MNEIKMTSKALIIGNGLTRQKYDLNEFKKQKYVIFGTNAIYRTCKCLDYLISIDVKIIEEINKSKFPKSKFIVPPLEEQFEPKEFDPNGHRQNAGMIAMNEAIKKGHKDLYCIGMDFVLENKNLNLGNIYDNTNGYGPETRASYFDTICRARFMNWFANKQKETNFIFMFPEIYKIFLKRNLSAKNISMIYSDNVSV